MSWNSVEPLFKNYMHLFWLFFKKKNNIGVWTTFIDSKHTPSSRSVLRKPADTALVVTMISTPPITSEVLPVCVIEEVDTGENQMCKNGPATRDHFSLDWNWQLVLFIAIMLSLFFVRSY